MQDRVLPFEGINNFRDYGGYAGADGRRLKTGLLFRSAQHRLASPADLVKITAIGFAQVVDLRGQSERKAQPCVRPPSFAAVVHVANGETVGSDKSMGLRANMRTVEDTNHFMRAIYADMPFLPALKALFATHLQSLASLRQPSLIHCVAGKDRTGIAVALVHHLTGVSREDMFADYLLTNQAARIEERLAGELSETKRHYGPKMDNQAVRTLLTVNTEFLDIALCAMERAHGSIDGYCEQVLGIDAATKMAIRDNVLEG